MKARKYDWVRCAFILIELGEMPSESLSFYYCKFWPRRGRTSRSLSQVIRTNMDKGFFISSAIPCKFVYGFEGELPDVDRSTLRRWKDKVSPLKGVKP